MPSEYKERDVPTGRDRERQLIAEAERAATAAGSIDSNELRQNRGMIRVKATREGLIGGKTASGWIITPYRPFVALPSTKALRRMVHVRNPVNNFECFAEVLDVGPWNEHDDAYVLHGARPAAESEIDTRGRKTNGAGIDLGEAVWRSLGMVDNSDVEWEFVLG